MFTTHGDIERVQDPDGPAAQRTLVLEVDTWDINCPKHITPRYTQEEWQQRAT